MTSLSFKSNNNFYFDNKNENIDNTTNSKNIISVIFFDYNSSLLDSQSIIKLKNVIEIISNSQKKYYIIGYADNSGGESYNLQLSKKRGENVRTHLVSLGIASNRLIVQGYGENNEYPDQMQNRRVEIIQLN